jgi:hypothetical protein
MYLNGVMRTEAHKRAGTLSNLVTQRKTNINPTKREIDTPKHDKTLMADSTGTSRRVRNYGHAQKPPRINP